MRGRSKFTVRGCLLMLHFIFFVCVADLHYCPSSMSFSFFFLRWCAELPTTTPLLPNGIQTVISGEEDQKGSAKNATSPYAWQFVSRHKGNIPKCPAG